MNNKTDLRIWAKSIRKTLNMTQKSCELVEKIRHCKHYKSANNVMIFYPTKYEVNLLDLLSDEKDFYLPKVCNNQLYICPFQLGDKLIKSCFNIEEPCSNPVDPKILDLVIVPALAADKKNYRLGYGGGFYDRFLKENKKLKSILPIAQELVIEKLPCEDFDEQVDIVISC